MRPLSILIPLLCGWCLVAPRAAYGDDITNLGGDLSNALPGRHAIQVAAPNLVDEQRRAFQLSGFADFHQSFTQESGLGPTFVNASCGGCHRNNGRGFVRVSSRTRGRSSVVVKVSLPGDLDENGAPREVPGVGEQLRNHALDGRSGVRITLGWRTKRGAYPDGTPFELRRPVLTYRIRGASRRRIIASLRMTPAIIGPGLLEAIPEETLLGFSDPLDGDGDGVSGRPNMVPNRRTGELAIGRFGFKGSHPTVEQQSAAALYFDIGVTNSLFFDADEPLEYLDSVLDRLVFYQKLAGVPRARNQQDPGVTGGKELFERVGCAACHRMTVTTGTVDDPELSDQLIHPFTDLLLHDMGRGLADRRPEYSASGSEWKTAPLWGLGHSRRLAGRHAAFLHDGRARTIEEAILWHGGEAAGALRAFKRLSRREREDLLAFLDAL